MFSIKKENFREDYYKEFEELLNDFFIDKMAPPLHTIFDCYYVYFYFFLFLVKQKKIKQNSNPLWKLNLSILRSSAEEILFFFPSALFFLKYSRTFILSGFFRKFNNFFYLLSYSFTLSI